MRNFRNPWTLLGLYVISILLFSFVYYRNWIKNTTSFVIETQTNELTYDAGFSYIDEIIPYDTRTDRIPFSITDFNRLLKPYFAEIKIKNDSLDYLKKTIPQGKTTTDSISHLLMKSYSENVENEIQKHRQPFNDSISNKWKMINQSKDEIDIANIKVEIAQLEYELAKKELMIRESALRNMTFYQDPNIREEFELTYSEYLNNLDKKSELEVNIRDLRSNIIDLKNNFHTNRSSKIGFSNFLYFSFLTSTTTSFGDIIPNTSTIRLIISTQIFVSLLLFGFLINIITGKILNKNNKEAQPPPSSLNKNT